MFSFWRLKILASHGNGGIDNGDYNGNHGD